VILAIQHPQQVIVSPRGSPKMVLMHQKTGQDARLFDEPKKKPVKYVVVSEL
jgi:hypothetical protein